MKSERVENNNNNVILTIGREMIGSVFSVLESHEEISRFGYPAMLALKCSLEIQLTLQ